MKGIVYQSILITGPKHSGKSLSARALGKIMGCDSVDLDEVIEKQTGKTPRALFIEGPEIFKKAEALALASLIQGRQRQRFRIISAGGGLIDNSEALALLSMRREIIVAYLDVSAETAWQRIARSAAGGELPPFLNTPKPKETHLALHERRAGAYKALALITISAEDKSPEEIAQEIAERLEPSHSGMISQ